MTPERTIEILRKGIEHITAVIRLNESQKWGRADCSGLVENREAYKFAIAALEKTADKDCSQCLDRGKCAIHDNFNIDYCSDWRNV